jgi:hypothetical protein
VGENHKEELYSSSCIMRIIKSRMLKLARRVSDIGHMGNKYNISVIKTEGKGLLERNSLKRKM